MPRRKSTHVDDPVAVGRRLREARERAGLSQRQLSFPAARPPTSPDRGRRPHPLAPAPPRDGQAARRERGLSRDGKGAARRARGTDRGRARTSTRRADELAGQLYAAALGSCARRETSGPALAGLVSSPSVKESPGGDRAARGSAAIWAATSPNIRLGPTLSAAPTRCSTSSSRRSRSSALARQAAERRNDPVETSGSPSCSRTRHRQATTSARRKAPRTHRRARSARERSDLPSPALLVAITAPHGPGGHIAPHAMRGRRSTCSS